MQARATLFSFSHFVAHLLSKVTTLHGCELLRTVAARLSAMLKVAAGGRNCLTRSNVSRALSQNCRVANTTFASESDSQCRTQRAALLDPVLPFHSLYLRHSTLTQLHFAKAHRRSDCSPVDQNILETFLALVAVHRPSQTPSYTVNVAGCC